MALAVICILHDDKKGCNSVWPTKLAIPLGLHKDWAADGLIPCKPDTENYDYAVKEQKSPVGTGASPTGKPPKELGHFELHGESPSCADSCGWSRQWDRLLS